MKNIFFTLFLLIISIYSLKAQYSIGVSYIFSDITTDNISVFGKYNLKNRHHFSLGLKYHFNNDTTTTLNRFYYRSLYTSNLLNKFGFTFEYRFYFLKNKLVNPYMFYSFQYLRIGSKVKKYSFINNPANTFEEQITFDPVNIFENHVGFGLDVKFDKRIFVFMGISGGRTFYTDLNDLDDLNNGTATVAFIDPNLSEFSWLFSTGIIYKIGKDKKKNKITER